MFPFDPEETQAWTDYGRVLKPDEFRKVRGESLSALSALNTRCLTSSALGYLLLRSQSHLVTACHPFACHRARKYLFPNLNNIWFCGINKPGTGMPRRRNCL
jgi:hypothetical protein